MSDLVLAGVIVAVPALLLFGVLGSRWPVLALCVVPLSFPVEQLDLPGLPVRVVQVASLGAVGLVAIHQRIGRQPLLPRSPLLFAAGLVVFSALVSTVVAVDPLAALRLDAGYLVGLALAGAIAVGCPQAGAVRLLIGCTCAVGTFICAAGLTTANDLRSHYGASVVDNRATGFFGQPNELGAFAAVMVVLGLGLVFSSRRRQARLLAVLSVLVSTAALVVSLSRGSWLGLGLGLVILVILAPALGRPLARGLLVLSGAVAVAAATLPSSPLLSIVVDRAASLVDGRRNPYDDRPAIWREALRQITQRAALGSGPGGYPVLALRSPSRVTTVAPNHAHDLALTVLAEQGVVGIGALAIAVTVAVFAVARTVRSHRDRPAAWRWNGERELLAGTAAALAVVLGQGVLDYPLRNPVLATVVWLLIGSLAAMVRDGRRPERERTDQPAGLVHSDIALRQVRRSVLVRRDW